MDTRDVKAEQRRHVPAAEGDNGTVRHRLPDEGTPPEIYWVQFNKIMEREGKFVFSLQSQDGDAAADDDGEGGEWGVEKEVRKWKED